MQLCSIHYTAYCTPYTTFYAFPYYSLARHDFMVRKAGSEVKARVSLQGVNSARASIHDCRLHSDGAAKRNPRCFTLPSSNGCTLKVKCSPLMCPWRDSTRDDFKFTFLLPSKDIALLFLHDRSSPVRVRINQRRVQRLVLLNL